MLRQSAGGSAWLGKFRLLVEEGKGFAVLFLPFRKIPGLHAGGG
jgi:hypothetical protein